MANIEHVNVGGQVYDIRVPNGSSLSLSSLNVTGTITASTANLSVVKCAGKPLTVSLENTFGIFDFYQADRLRNKISLEFPLDTDHDFTLSLPNIDSNQATLLTTENAPFVVTDNEVYSKGVEVRLKDTNHVILLGAGLRTNGQEDGVKITIGDRVVIGPLYINAVTNNSTYIDA